MGARRGRWRSACPACLVDIDPVALRAECGAGLRADEGAGPRDGRDGRPFVLLLSPLRGRPNAPTVREALTRNWPAAKSIPALLRAWHQASASPSAAFASADELAREGLDARPVSPEQIANTACLCGGPHCPVRGSERLSHRATLKFGLGSAPFLALAAPQRARMRACGSAGAPGKVRFDLRPGVGAAGACMAARGGRSAADQS